MAITRSQIARQLMQEGGVPRQGYFLGKLVKKIKDDIIPNELKTDLGKAATAAALGYGLNRFGIPGTSKIGTTGENIGKGSISNVFRGIGNIFRGGSKPVDTEIEMLKRAGEIPTTDNDKGFIGKTIDFFKKDRLGTDKSIADLLMTPQALAIGSGLLAGAFTKDKDDPAFTGQDVGLNLRDIRRLANVTDPKAGQAIGLSFLPDVEARKFTPAEMAASFAAADPVDFTEDRTPAEDGGLIKEAEKYATQKQSEFLKNVDMSNIPGTGNLQREQERAYDNAYKEYMKRNTKADGGIIDFNKISQQRKKVSKFNKGGMARACGAVKGNRRKITKFS